MNPSLENPSVGLGISERPKWQRGRIHAADTISHWRVLSGSGAGLLAETQGEVRVAPATTDEGHGLSATRSG